jgi:hypothetical protein
MPPQSQQMGPQPNQPPPMMKGGQHTMSRQQYLHELMMKKQQMQQLQQIKHQSQTSYGPAQYGPVSMMPIY